MGDKLERAALDGTLFTFDNTPSSPARSVSSSSSSRNTDDELASDLELDPGSSRNRIGQRGDTSGRGVPPLRKNGGQQVEHDGPQTGPKGVIEDRKAANALAKSQRDEENRIQNAEFLRKGMGGLTVHEEEELVRAQKVQTQAQEEERGVEEWRRKRRLELQGRGEKDEDDREEEDGEEARGAKRGGLREVGKEGFVSAVERTGWVVVLIYEPGIPRCTSLLASLLHLSLNLPPNLSIPITLYRARATSLAFSLLPPGQGVTHQPEGEDEEDEDEEIPRGRPDPDVLPTMLAYKDGELEKTWIRVDWDVSQDGVEGLLRRKGILPPIQGNADRRASSQRGLLDGSDEDE
nr:uncharacterized protein CI109_002037 [Kwoniella shandongensis]KAA5529612.1 hypothetical protein CI109_002037 [Kwoniella shandongensis]